MLCVNTFLTHIVCMHVCVIMIINWDIWSGDDGPK